MPESKPAGRESPPPSRQTGAQQHDPPGSGHGTGNEDTQRKNLENELEVCYISYVRRLQSFTNKMLTSFGRNYPPTPRVPSKIRYLTSFPRNKGIKQQKIRQTGAIHL